MLTFLKAALVATLGLALGFWLSDLAAETGSPFDRVRVGAWTIVTQAGSPDADPYTRLYQARSGEIPLALGEGLQMIARVDDRGRPLDGRCAYRVGPRVPPARFWTLSLADPQGFPVDNRARRYGFRSTELMRAQNGDFSIVVSATAMPGDWLPIGAPGPFELALRLYDSPVSATAGGIEPSAAPRVERTGCA